MINAVAVPALLGQLRNQDEESRHNHRAGIGVGVDTLGDRGIVGEESCERGGVLPEDDLEEIAVDVESL